MVNAVKVKFYTGRPKRKSGVWLKNLGLAKTKNYEEAMKMSLPVFHRLQLEEGIDGSEVKLFRV